MGPGFESLTSHQ